MEHHLGFTGTRQGMSYKQLRQVESLLGTYRQAPYHYTHLHHGDCLGADVQAHRIARRLGYKIVLHPPADSSRRAFLDPECTEVRTPESYLIRDLGIVIETDRLIATPSERVSSSRSGTWATIRRARNLRRPIDIVNP